VLKLLHYDPRKAFGLGALLGICLALWGCTSPLREAAKIASEGRLRPLILPGAGGLQHQAYAREVADGDLLTVFVEGDGSPWTRGGTRIAPDPSSKDPLALKLAAKTPGSVLYLGRPCYLRAAPDPTCSSRLWTSGRYSTEVVASMNQALQNYLRQLAASRRIMLVGYSGGGTIVVLMARDLPEVIGLVTIAGNLDTEAWTRFHHYVALSNSMNPASLGPLPPRVHQWHLIGTRDTNVPYEAAKAYLAQPAAGQVRVYQGFDHACCWERAWPREFASIERELGAQSR
jgi:hypothetical protein